MNKKEAAWRLRGHTALLAVLLAAMLVLTLAIYFLEQSRPDPDALTVGLEDSVIISISEKRVAQTLAQGAEQDNIKIIKPSLYSVVQPDPQTSKYALFEQMLIAQSCDVVIGTAKTAKELFRLGLILPVENIGFEFEGEYLAGCVELGYVDFTGSGDYLYHDEKDSVCAYILSRSNNRQAALDALEYMDRRFNQD